MSDSDYLTRAEAALAAIERALDDTEADIELERSGNVLTLEFENRSKIIVNLQPPMSEIWIAAKAGGFHFRFVDGEWRDTRSGTEFFAALSEYATQQAGEHDVLLGRRPREEHRPDGGDVESRDARLRARDELWRDAARACLRRYR